MANKRITQFGPIEASQIVDQDVLTLVSVFEIDPALRNKKITFSNFREYLDQYYVNSAETDPFIAPNVLVQGYAMVSGYLSAGSGFVASGDSDFINDVTVHGDLYVNSGLTVTENVTTNQLNAFAVVSDTAIIDSGTFTTIATGVTAAFTTGLFDSINVDTITGTTFTGTTLNVEFANISDTLTATTGIFDVLKANQFDVSGIVISGDLVVDNITATGVISGATITGDLVNVSSGNFEHLVVSQDLTVTGDLNIDDIVADQITANYVTAGTGTFVFVSGAVISGDTGLFDTLNVQQLNAASLEFSGDRQISGNVDVEGTITVSGNSYIGSGLYVSGEISGTTITGTSGLFTYINATTISGGSATFTGLIVNGPATITGNTNIGDNLDVTNDLSVGGNLTVTGTTTLSGLTTLSGGLVVNGTTELSGDTSISGDLTITSGNIVGDGNTSITGIDFLHVSSGYIDNNLVVSGDLNVSGQIIFNDLVTDDLIVGGDLLVSGSTVIDDNLTVTGDLTAVNITGVTVTGTNANFTNGTFITLNSDTVEATSVSGTTISGEDGFFDNLTVSGTFVINDDLDLNGDLHVESGLYVGGSGTISGDLLVSGEGVIQSGLAVSGGQILAPFGTVSAPGFAYAADPSMGIMNDAGGAMTHTVNGVSGMTLTTGVCLGNDVAILTIWAT